MASRSTAPPVCLESGLRLPRGFGRDWFPAVAFPSASERARIENDWAARVSLLVNLSLAQWRFVVLGICVALICWDMLAAEVNAWLALRFAAARLRASP